MRRGLQSAKFEAPLERAKQARQVQQHDTGRADAVQLANTGHKRSPNIRRSEANAASAHSSPLVQQEQRKADAAESRRQSARAALLTA